MLPNFHCLRAPNSLWIFRALNATARNKRKSAVGQTGCGDGGGAKVHTMMMMLLMMMMTTMATATTPNMPTQATTRAQTATNLGPL